MRLTELEPQFVRCIGPGRHQDVAALADAHGIELLCPKCLANAGGPAGVHGLLIWFRDCGVPDDEAPGPGRWRVAGTGYDDLSLAPSVNLTGPGCGWHGWVTNGLVTSC